MTPLDHYPPRRRRSDDSSFWRAADWLRHYAIIWWPLLWLLSSLGYSVITPRLTAAQVQEDAHQTDRRLQLEVDSIKTVHSAYAEQLRELQFDVHALVRLDCIDPHIERALKIVASLPCNN